jgi:hypothetical protein
MQNTIITLLSEICRNLEQESIDYMISGSMALNIYATPRMTRDIDFVVHLQLFQLEKFMILFQQDFYCHEASVREGINHKSMFNLIHHKTGYKVDFIIRKDTVFRQNEFIRRQRTNIFGFDAWVVSVEDLIISKLDWIQILYSTKQIEDIENLLENPTIDRTYLLHWCKVLELNTFNLL